MGGEILPSMNKIYPFQFKGLFGSGVYAATSTNPLIPITETFVTITDTSQFVRVFPGLYLKPASNLYLSGTVMTYDAISSYFVPTLLNGGTK